MLILIQSAAPDGTSTSFLLFGCVLFAILLMVYIFSPSDVDSGEEKTRLAFLYERKEQLYENLRDLNFEYKAGKLSEGDFASLRDSLEHETAATLAEIDQLEKARPVTARG